MQKIVRLSKRLTLLLTFLMLTAAFVAGCDGGDGQRYDNSAANSGNSGSSSGVLPTVTSTAPANQATGVALNTRLLATFSQAIDPASLTSASFTLAGANQAPLAGSLAVTGLTVTFTPNSNLAANTLYTATIAAGARNFAGNALASSYVWTFTTGAAADVTPPTVTSTTPANQANNVPLNSSVLVVFSEAMDPATINATSFTLSSPGGGIAGVVTYVGTTATFTPSSPLSGNTVFTATITNAARDLAGNTLVSNYPFSFTTGASPDTTPPLVTAVTPANRATGVPVNSALTTTFTEALDPLTVTTATYTLTGAGGVAVPGTVTYSGRTATLTPSSNLTGNTLFTATVTTGVKDLAGNRLASNFVSTFTTGATPDTTAPMVTSVTPTSGATGVPVNSALTTTFTEALDPLTVTTATYTLTKAGGVAVPGTVTYSGTTATFTPSSNLAGNTLFTATITTGVKDLAGNPLASNFVSTFTTGASPDTTAPRVTSVTPTNGATGVPVNSALTTTFTEALDPLTVTTATYTLTGPGSVAVPGTVTYSGTTATFTPNANLAGNTLFTATVTTGVRDLAGNPLASNFVSTFTTGATPDTTPPTVTSTVPADTATGVAINSKQTATFSEAMDPLTITTATFTLSAGGSNVAGAVSYSGLTATFTPSANLLSNTVYTATITTGARDLAGNALATNKVTTFTTAAAADTTPPTVVSTLPANNATGVSINFHPSVTFSEAMDPLTITTATFTVSSPTAQVPGTVSYSGTIATFTPTTTLAANTVFTGTVTTGARDLAGNPLANNFVWTFTTGSNSAPGSVALGQIAPFGSFGGGSGMTNQGILTVINGDIGTTGVPTVITGFHDLNGHIYTETPLNMGFVNGTVYTAPPSPGTAQSLQIASQAAADAQTAYNNLSPASLPGGTDPGAGQLGGLTLAPGIYKAAGGTFQITGSDLTLNGQGDPNAVWVFQTAASLTVGAPAAPRSVILTNGAQAKNVYWQVGSAATINGAGGGTMVGTIIASAGVTFSTSGVNTLTVLNGRAIGLNASVTMVNTNINVPAP